jgi:hypothetical protein
MICQRATLKFVSVLIKSLAKKQKWIVDSASSEMWMNQMHIDSAQCYFDLRIH